MLVRETKKVRADQTTDREVPTPVKAGGLHMKKKMNAKEIIHSILQKGILEWKESCYSNGYWKYTLEENVIEIEQRIFDLGVDEFKAWSIQTAKNNEIGIFPQHSKNPRKDIEHALSFLEEVEFIKRFLAAHVLSQYPRENETKYCWMYMTAEIMDSKFNRKYPIEQHLHTCLAKRIKDAVYLEPNMPMIIPCIIELHFSIPQSAHERLQALTEYEKFLLRIQNKPQK